MRIPLPAFLLLQLAFSCAGQGTFYFQNLRPPDGINAPVYDGQGNKLTGSDYLAMLYVGSTADSLQPALRLADRSVAIEPFSFAPGYVFGGPVEAVNVALGALAWVEMRAWDARLGATYDEARLLGLGGYGESSLFQVRAGVDSGVGPIPAPLVGLQSFSLLPEVPEPSTICMVLLGLWIVWSARRYRRKQTAPAEPLR